MLICERLSSISLLNYWRYLKKAENCSTIANFILVILNDIMYLIHNNVPYKYLKYRNPTELFYQLQVIKRLSYNYYIVHWLVSFKHICYNIMLCFTVFHVYIFILFFFGLYKMGFLSLSKNLGLTWQRNYINDFIIS